MTLESLLGNHTSLTRFIRDITVSIEYEITVIVQTTYSEDREGHDITSTPAKSPLCVQVWQTKRQSFPIRICYL